MSLVASFRLAAAAEDGEEKFDPSHEFALPPWVEIKLGGLNLSINKAVAYQMLASLVSMALGIRLMRVRVGVRPDMRHTLGESRHGLTRTQIAEPM